jgi:hypothetical protein
MTIQVQIEDTPPEERMIEVQIEDTPPEERMIEVRVYGGTINPEDFPAFLRSRMGSVSVKDFAAGWGMTPALVYALLSGKRDPSKDILKRLGLEVVYAVRETESN